MRILIVSLITSVFVATVSLGWLFDYLYNQYVQDDTKTPVSSITAIEQFGSDLQSMLINGQHSQQALVSLISQWPDTGNYKLSLMPIHSLSLPKKLRQQLIAGEPLTLASEDDIAIYYYLTNNQQLLVLTSPLMNQQTPTSLNRYVFTGLFYLCLLLLMLLWLYPLINRLLALRQMAKAFGQGKLEQRVNVGSISYIRDLEIEFNHMAQRISDLVGDVKLLSSAVSHDLRTPLATIRFGMDTLQEEDDPELRKKFEQRISDNVDEMIELVEILLNYARLDQSLVTVDKATIKLTPVLEQIINNQHNPQIQFFLKHPHNNDITVYADNKYLSMLLKNLIKNATQHCQKKVTITIEDSAEQVLIVVSDDGAGIEESQREQIIKPFVRGKAEHKGYGIGLAIVQRILHWHNGTLTIGNDDELGGAKFSVTLPKQG
ncbi:GHKL domain-containing protein [Psychrosphaera sp. B3R10]|uniref:ATP-binding protein n=1 Tax=unclassified Psychrosphaera TaxID=2641570 RepID=UPI001C09ECFB|nr:MULTISPECIES: ATP-binding protein [unclassified Psychrosphaera]MBU2880429.1 GHKL domain-containing protein [Psychrosphaera sp. I2R16]MBU2987868.1 GHKL domain-containing protein [Psychrosphaera sp. B3R10]